MGWKLLAAFLVFTPIPLCASVRLTYQVNGTPVPVSWQPSAFPIRCVVDRQVADAFPQGTATIAKAENEWAAVPGAQVSFQPPAVGDGIRPGKDGQNAVTFVDDLFKGQNFLALTTNWYDDSGHIIEADIQVDPSVVAGGYNLQLLVAHETGHLLGLDHSGVISSVMYPYIGRSGSPDLDSDDRVAISTVYPSGNPSLAGGTLEGAVNGDDGGIFGAQVVAMNDSGEPVATVLTDRQGRFMIEGVPPGNYRLYAEPLDGPVDARNLSGIWSAANTASFPTVFAAADPIHVERGNVYGNLVIDTHGSETLNPKWVGAFVPGRSQVSLGSCPLTIAAGQTLAIAVGGDGFTSGMTNFEIPNSGFERVSDFSWSGNYVWALFRISEQTPPGSLVILVHSGNESAALTGALRLEQRTRVRVAQR